MSANSPTVIDRKLMRTSPSAIETFLRCETAWWLRYVGKAEERIRLSVVRAQNLGTRVHKELEDWQKGGAEPTMSLAKALMKYAPLRGPDVLIEGSTDPTLSVVGVPVTGRIDFAHGRIPTRPIVGDWKTRSDLGKYQKTEDELRKDIQMNCYAKWAWLFYDKATSVDVAHYYVETKKHKDKDGNLIDPGHPPAVDSVMVNFSVDDTKKIWSSVEQAVERMKVVAAYSTAAEAGHPTDFVSRNSPCNAFGGCGYKYACPHSPFRIAAVGANKTIFEGTGSMSALTELLAKRRTEGVAAPVIAPVVSAELPTPGGITRPETPVSVEAKLVSTQEQAVAAVLAKPVAAERAGRDCAKDGHLYDQAGDKCVCGRGKPGRKPKAEAVDVTEAAGNVKSEVVAQAAATAPVHGDDAMPYKRVLLVNAGSSEAGYTDLTTYVGRTTQELATKLLGEGRTDPRFAEKNSPLAYGGWRGALAELIRSRLPTGDKWCIWTNGDEFAEVAAAALALVEGVEVIRGR